MKRLTITLLIAFSFLQYQFNQTVRLDNGIAKLDISLSGGIIKNYSLNSINVNPIHEYGHFICFDRWGPSSAEDQALGIPQHGEASKIPWTLIQEPVKFNACYYSEMICTLPIVNLGMRRKIYLNGNSSVFKVVEEITNYNDTTKVFNLVQHPTIGAPFLDETTIVDTKVDSGFSQAGNLPPTHEEILQWPNAVVDGNYTDLRYLMGDSTWWQSVLSFVTNDSNEFAWVTAVNPSLNLMLGYVWPTSEYPWLNLWLNLKNKAPYARGLEFGSTGLHQPWPVIFEIDSIFNKKMFEELEKGEKRTKSYYAFLSEVPSDYKGVESVSITDSSINVEEYDQNPERTIKLDIRGILAAQEQVIIIEGGTENKGLLETIINGDTTETGEKVDPNRIYELKSGEIYYQQSPIIVENPEGTITIRGQKGGRKPVILKEAKSGTEIGSNQLNSSLTIQNIQFHNMDVDGVLPWSCWNIKGNDHSLLVEDCLFEHCNGIIWNLNSVLSGAVIKIRNSYFRDLNNFSQWWASRVVQCKVPVDTFIFENNTVTGGGLTILGQECLFDYSIINHNTFINNHKHPFYNKYWKEVYFTNNLFVNTNMVGEDWENVAIGGSDPNMLLNGISGLDSISLSILLQGKYLNEDTTALTSDIDEMTDIIYYAADNVVVYSETLDSYYNGDYNDVWDDAPASYLTWGGVEGPFKVVNVPGVWVNSRSQEIINQNENIVDENNSIYEFRTSDLGLGTDPLPEDAAEVFIQWNRYQWAVPDVENPTDYSAYYFGDYDPSTIPGIETEDSQNGGITKISDLIEDFSYTKELISESDGLRIGALHWNNEKFDRNASIAAVKLAYQNYTPVHVKTIRKTSNFNLNNYPNPFKYKTILTFQIPEKSHVNVSIYDLSGRLVETIVDEERVGGLHHVEVTSGNKKNGIYICKLTSNNNSSIRKITLIK